MEKQVLDVLPVCVDGYLPGEHFDRSELPSILELRPISHRELALAKYKLWETGQTLRIRFLDGDEELRSRVEGHARKWLQHANLQFEFGNFPDAVIRITFKGSGYWSLVGTDATKCPDPQPTMSLGGFTAQTDNLVLQQVILHEFGHAIGCVHEQANPTIEIPWDEAKVYAYYWHHYGWDTDKVHLNVLKRYPTSEVYATPHDRYSIMQYAVPNELTKGDFHIGWNTNLSDTDMAWIRAMYPYPPTAEQELDHET